MSKTSPKNRIGSFLPNHLSDVDTLIDQFFSNGRSAAAQAAVAVPAALWEEDQSIFVEIDAPGVSSKDVNVTFDKGQLTLELTRNAPEHGDNAPNYVYHQRRYGTFAYSVSLPDSVDPESIEASLNDGVLRVEIGKLPTAQPRKIEIREN